MRLFPDAATSTHHLARLSARFRTGGALRWRRFAAASGAAALLLALTVPGSAAWVDRAVAAPTITTPVAMVTAMVSVEKHARHQTALFRYVSEERSARTGGHLWRENVVETPDGLLRRLVAEDGKPLSAARAAEEDHRIAELVAHPSLFRLTGGDRRADEERMGRLLDILPRAFFWTEAGSEGDCVRIAFQPNPQFTPSGYDERIVHALAGTVLIARSGDRLCRIDGHLVSRINFGYGLLGHLEPDGHFSVTRVPVTPQDWKSSRILVHFDGKILLLKSISRDEDARHMDAQPLAPNLTLAEAAELTRAH